MVTLESPSLSSPTKGIDFGSAKKLPCKDCSASPGSQVAVSYQVNTLSLRAAVKLCWLTPKPSD